MPHTGNASIILLVAQSSFLQTGWHNILSNLQDGAKKIILNAGAFEQTDNHELQGFLRYVKTGELTTDYTKRIESMIQTVKMSEQARQEYRFKSAVIMDAEDRGSRQAKFETAAAFKRLGIDIAKIAEGTGLSCEEIEKL